MNGEWIVEEGMPVAPWLAHRDDWMERVMGYYGYFDSREEAQEYCDWKNTVPLPTYVVEECFDEDVFTVTKRGVRTTYEEVCKKLTKAQAEAVAKALNETPA